MDNTILQKINDYIWEIPRTFRSDMLAPVRIFASEKMLNDILRDESLMQAVNVATLPAIQKHSLVMPDIHEGYGFPVGGVAAMDTETGVISPGGIGFDINCAHPDTIVNLAGGANIKIKNLKDLVISKKNNAAILNKSQNKIIETEIINWFSRQEKQTLYSIKSKLGFSIKVTGDHPIYDGCNMNKAESLKVGDKIAVYPFSGVEYQEPDNIVLINQDKIVKAFRDFGLPNDGNRHAQILSWFKNKGFINLKLNSWQTPYLIKIMGLLFGDGTMNFVGKNKKGFVSFYGREEDLLKAQEDLSKLGIKSKLYKRKRQHSVKNHYGKIYNFEFTEYSLHINSTALVILFHLLGAPIGKKTYCEFLIPVWLWRSPLWYKRLFLAAFFGAEMSKPATMNKYNFYNPTLNINKLIPLKENGIKFLAEIKKLLREFGIRSSNIVEVDGLANKGKTAGFRFQIYGDSQNLIRFFKQVGFEYHREKQKLANLAVAYLQYKERIIDLRKRVRELVRDLYERGVSSQALIKNYTGLYVEPQFIEHSIWTEERVKPRIAFNFLSFEEFIKEYSLGEDGVVIDEIEAIEKEPYEGPVYDITVNHPDHNFIANNFIVSNCGVRLLRSDKTFAEIRDKIPALTAAIYSEVPSGVGRGGRLKLVNKELDDVLTRGSEKMLEAGYAAEEDLKNCESGGRLQEANPDLVSKHAKDRGRDQLGTIGAGNHFVEIQRVDKIFDSKVAARLGLYENQVCIMVHCGSRGLGHQAATDYIQVMLKSLSKYGISLPDNQLACAPFNSPEGKNYFAAMAAAANFAWANRQMITWEIRNAWRKVFGGQASDVGSQLSLVYDVAHNIAKLEEYEGKKVIVHRKGATRAFPDQPVLIPGSMGTASYVLIGTENSLRESFGSSCHGAGRTMSRTRAKKVVRGSVLKQELESKGISVEAGSMSGLAEEAPIAYKDVEEVVEVVHQVGIAKKVARLKPVGVIKG
jgi:tRNA-splicing ligase RtcB